LLLIDFEEDSFEKGKLSYSEFLELLLICEVIFKQLINMFAMQLWQKRNEKKLCFSW
jgi:hypothetical protein